MPGDKKRPTGQDPAVQPMSSIPTELDVLRRLHDLNMFLGSTTDLGQLVERLLDDVIELHDADFGNIQLYDPAAKILRIAAQRGFKQPFLNHFAEVDADEGSACGMALRSGRRIVIEDVEQEPEFAPSLAAARDAGYRSVQSTPMFGPLGETVGMISTHFRAPRRFTNMQYWLTDLYARQAGFAIGAKRAEEALRAEQRRQQHLLAELQHRVRNTLAVIRSIVRRTAASSSSVEELEQHLDGRLGAFARTQAYVTRDPEGGVDLELIIRDELLAHASEGSQNVTINGPLIRLSAEVAETMSLAVHELTTNAIKHGALGSDGNMIEVEWSVTGPEGERMLHFGWHERLTGRTIEKPSRSGFGTELLDRVVRYELDAEPTIEFKPDGLSYDVAIPLASIVPSH